MLILSSDLDFATDRVCQHLARADVPFLRLNREALADVALTLDPVRRTLVGRRENDTWCVGENVRSVWWRQGTFDRNPTFVESSIAQQMSRTQWSAFTRSLMALDQPVWVNNPCQVYRAEAKSVQLSVAARLGFDVPRTMMTNDRDADVPNAVGSRVALKSIDTLLLRQGAYQLFGYTSLTEWRHVATEDLKFAPVTVQAAIERKLDLRVTVVGDDVWCVAIASRGAGIEGDWRLTAKSDIEVCDYELPAPVVARCRQLVQALGLKYGAIDLALAEEKYWFIEINPTGEWGWLDCPSRPIASRIAHYLANPC